MQLMLVDGYDRIEESLGILYFSVNNTNPFTPECEATFTLILFDFGNCNSQVNVIFSTERDPRPGQLCHFT